MKKNFFLLLIFCCSCFVSHAQKFLTRQGVIRFFSEAPLENIEAVNRQVVVLLNKQTGDVAVKVTIKAFEFQKAAMQEHFNRDYLHSDKYPLSAFEGKILNLTDWNNSLSRENFQARVSGKLTIHNITREITEYAFIKEEGNGVSVSLEFQIQLTDYEIKVPSDKVRNISNNIKIFFHAKLEPYNP